MEIIAQSQNSKNKLATQHMRCCIDSDKSILIRPIEIRKKYTTFEVIKEDDKNIKNTNHFIILPTLKYMEDYDEQFKTKGIELSKKFTNKHEAHRVLKRLHKRNK